MLIKVVFLHKIGTCDSLLCCQYNINFGRGNTWHLLLGKQKELYGGNENNMSLALFV